MRATILAQQGRVAGARQAAQQALEIEPGHFPAGQTLNGIVAHEDWLPTFAAAAGAPDIKEKLKTGVELNGRKYSNYIDGHNLLDYPPSQSPGCFNLSKIEEQLKKSGSH